jgi:hypothetical protein
LKGEADVPEPLTLTPPLRPDGFRFESPAQ